MAGLNNYDQWKTASPGDNDPDWIEEAEKYIKNNSPDDEEKAYAFYIIEGLLEIMKEEGVY